MRIEGNQSVQSISVYQQTKQSAPSGNKPSGTENARDEVNISQEAKALHQQTVRDVTSPERVHRMQKKPWMPQTALLRFDARQVVEKMIRYWKSL